MLSVGVEVGNPWPHKAGKKIWASFTQFFSFWYPSPPPNQIAEVPDAASPRAFQTPDLVGSQLSSLLPYDSALLVLLSQLPFIHLLLASKMLLLIFPTVLPGLIGFRLSF